MRNMFRRNKETKTTKYENAELKCYILMFICFGLGAYLHQLDVSIINTPYLHHLAKIVYQLSYAIAMAILISIVVNKQLDTPHKEKYEERMHDMREALNQDVFSEVFKRIIPDKIFETVKSDIILTDVCRSRFELRHEFIVQNDGSVRFNERIEYTLRNITQNELKFPIPLSANRDNFRLDSVQWEINGKKEFYDPSDKIKSKSICIDKDNPNLFTIPTIIPPNDTVRVISEFHRIYDRYNTRAIAGEYFFKHPTEDAEMEIIFPHDYNLFLSKWLQDILKEKENTETRHSYTFKKSVLPHVGFTYYIKKKEEPTQNMEALGIVTDNLLHNLNNDLQIIFNCWDLISQSFDDISNERKNNRNYHAKNVRHYLEKMNQSLSTVQSDVLRLQNYSRKSKSGRYPLNLSLVVNEALHLSSLKSSVQVNLSFLADADTVILNPIQIRYVLISLLDRISASRSESNCQLNLQLVNSWKDNHEFITLTIERISSPETKELFEEIRNEVTKENNSIVNQQYDLLGTSRFEKVNLSRIIENIKKWGGSFKFDYNQDNNLIVMIEFQVWDKNIHNIGPDSDTCFKRNESGIKILFIDDLSSVSEGSVQVLQRAGFTVSEFTNGEEAILNFEKNQKAYDIVITDTNMPNISGITLGKKIKEIRNDIPIIISTGGDERIDDEKVKKMGFQGQIPKPYTTDTIKRLILKTVSENH